MRDGHLRRGEIMAKLSKMIGRKAQKAAFAATSVDNILLSGDGNGGFLTERTKSILKKNSVIGIYRKRKRQDHIEISKQSAKIGDYISSKILHGGQRDLSFSDEILRNIERNIPEILVVPDIRRVRSIGESFRNSEPLESNGLDKSLIGIHALSKILDMNPQDTESLLQSILDGRHARKRDSEIPSVAPEDWQTAKELAKAGGKAFQESPPAFIKRVYGRWEGNGLDRALIRRLDPSLSLALDNWLRKNTLPNDLDLPTRNEKAARWVDRVEREGVAALAAEAKSGDVAREAARFLSAKHRRDKRIHEK
jgi:hypothetical protein